MTLHEQLLWMLELDEMLDDYAIPVRKGSMTVNGSAFDFARDLRNPALRDKLRRVGLDGSRCVMDGE